MDIETRVNDLADDIQRITDRLAAVEAECSAVDNLRDRLDRHYDATGEAVAELGKRIRALEMKPVMLATDSFPTGTGPSTCKTCGAW